MKVIMLVVFLFAPACLFAETPPSSKFFVLNSPSTASAGPDSILVLDLEGNSSTLVDTRLNIMGADDVACDPMDPQHIFLSVANFFQDIFEVREFDATGKFVNTHRGFGDPGGSLVIAFDHAGNFYVAGDEKIFKNGTVFATIRGNIHKLAVDSKGNLYITQSFGVNQDASNLLRIDPQGNVTLFADESDGLDSPFGLAIDSTDNIFVANNPPSAPAFILRIDPTGTATTFATDIAFQPIIRGMTFDSDDNLYVTLEEDTILKFDPFGNQSGFADQDDGIDFPVAIAFGNCPVVTSIAPCDCTDPNAITGGPEADVLVGTHNGDIICSFGGTDILRGHGGDDCLDGGTGNDTIFGGAGDDLLIGGNGYDFLFGNAGEDELRGQGGRDLLLGGKGNDGLRGGSDADLLLGGVGDDALRGGRGQDTCVGGSGADTAVSCEQTITVP